MLTYYNEHTDYDMIPVWENRRRIRVLKEYRKYIEYFMSDRIAIDTIYKEGQDKYWEVKYKYAKLVSKVYAAVVASRVDSTVKRYRSGFHLSQHVCAIQDVFGLKFHNISFNEVIEIVTRSECVYRRDLLRSLIRTINLFFWFWVLFELVADLPYWILRIFGVKPSRILAIRCSRFGPSASLALLGTQVIATGLVIFHTINAFFWFWIFSHCLIGLKLRAVVGSRVRYNLMYSPVGTVVYVTFEIVQFIASGLAILYCIGYGEIINGVMQLLLICPNCQSAEALSRLV